MLVEDGLERDDGDQGGGCGGGVLVREIVYEDSGALLHGEDGVLLDLGVWREDAFREALDHCAWEGEILLTRQLDVGIHEYGGLLRY